MRTRGFSLVELSIVLVILGLLVGGVLAGQSLIRAAQVRAVVSEHTRYQTALHSFRDKYFAIAGDMSNATRFWGVQAGATTDGRDATCAALTHTTPSTDSRTCNGDGNGRIDGVPSTNVYERYRVWQHLANAGLIEGQYTGVPGSGGIYNTIAGQNTPTSKTDGASWSHIYTGTITSAGGGLFVGNYGNVAEIRKDGATALSFLKPEEAWNIDTKMDDGLPAQGTVLPYDQTYQTNCTNGSVYTLSYSSAACSLLFKIGL